MDMIMCIYTYTYQSALSALSAPIALYRPLSACIGADRPPIGPIGHTGAHAKFNPAGLQDAPAGLQLPGRT